MRRLTAAHAKGTVRALQPHAHHLSPALGLFSSARTARRWRTATSGGAVRSSVPCELASTALADSRALRRSRPATRPCACRAVAPTRAAAHLGSAQIGTILGLGLNNHTWAASADAHDVKTALNRAGIETNRVHGEWTGVSLRRFLRLVELVREGGECAPAVALLLRLGWERREQARRPRLPVGARSRASRAGRRIARRYRGAGGLCGRRV